MILLTVSLVLLIGMSAFLSASETSLFSLSPMTLKSYETSENGKKKIVSSLMAHPRNTLVTLLILNVLVNILVQNAVANLFVEASWSVKVGIPLVLTLVFGEVLPKSMALQKNTQFSLFAAPIVDAFTRILRWVRNPLTRITSWISRVLFVFLRQEKSISLNEFRHILESSEDSGVLLPQECDLIEGSLDLQQSTAREQMRPRDEVLYYDLKQPLSHLIHLFVDLETTRVPVCDGSLEKVLGILSTKQYFLNREEIKKSEDVLAYLKKPYFVPETTKAWTLLRNLRERKESVALIVDEYGSISGLITQEDLIEEVFGEIRDRRDPPNLYTQMGKDVIIASGKLELSAFKEIFGVSLKSERSVVTLGGWLIEQLGSIPVTGTKHTIQHFSFYVLAAEPNRVKRIHVRHLR